MNIDGSIGNKYQGPIITRPFDFGTDAIEKTRVSQGQSLIDADFEYGLQSTKWQTYADIRKVPTFFEIPGTDYTVYSVACDGSTPAVVTANIYTTTQYPVVGSPISIQGLTNPTNTFDRAQGFFLVTSIAYQSPTMNTITFQAKGYMGASNLSTSYMTIRRAGFYNATSNVSSNVGIRIAQVQQVITPTSQVIVTTTTTHGLLPGTPISSNGFPTNFVGANGNFFIESTPLPNQFTYTPTGTVGSTQTQSGQVNSNIYPLTYAVFTHRPYDGGVLISPGVPAHGASCIRQSKKVFRYQSGKGLQWSSGTLFCPNNDVISVSATGNVALGGNVIYINTSIPHGCPQPGATIQLRGIQSPGYNGTYTVAGIVNSTNVYVNVTQNTMMTTSPVLADQPRFIISGWHGASVRAGTFDDQNGMFWEFDGQTLWVVKRSSTFQITGSANCAAGGQILIGTATRFTQQLKVGDKFTLRGMTHIVTGIQSDTQLTFNPPFRSTQSIQNPATVCKIKEVRTPQSLFNRDTLDGTGPSGFKFDPNKMQMVGLQYTWYGAGFIDFMMRGVDGNWVYAHRYKQNNINDEAYMRTGNMSVRYELVNETSHAVSSLANVLYTSDPTIIVNDQLTYWPNTGTVLVDNELITYSGKTSNTLTGLTRASTLNYNVIDQPYVFQAANAPAAHQLGNSVNLVSMTSCPSLTHWGSAFIMDGLFDQDRGYLFNYQVNNFTASLAAGTTTPLFMIRLAPSVSNGVIGDIGVRELFNRAQFLLQRLDVWVQSSNIGQGNAVFSGVLNPSFANGNITVPGSWQAINSAANGSQPSFAQVYTGTPLTNLGAYLNGSGERVFSTICNAGSQYSIDLSGLKEMCNGCIGGNNFFPDGPDTLLVYISVPTASPTITQYSLNIFWGEAQA